MEGGSSLLSLYPESVASAISQVNVEVWDSLINEIVDYFLSRSVSPTVSSPTRDADEALDAAYTSIEAMGFRIGVRLAELHSIDKKRVVEPLDCVKFICKDFWSLLFKKNVDNLKTNHRASPSSFLFLFELFLPYMFL